MDESLEDQIQETFSGGRVSAEDNTTPTASTAVSDPQSPIPPHLQSPVVALTQQELEAWRWHIEPDAQTAEQRSRAEVDRQPTIRDGFVDRVGRRRLAPLRVQTGAPLWNGYDQLVDMRVYSPNNRVIGFWDLDPEEIERENAFTSPDVIPSPPSSPIPEPGTLESMMYTSLSQPRPRTPEPFVDLPTTIGFQTTINHAPDSGIRPYELQDFTRRYLALAPQLRALLFVVQQRYDMMWMHALKEVEAQVWWYNLTQAKRVIFRNVQTLHARAVAAVDREEGLRARITEEFRDCITRDWPEDDDNNLDDFFETFKSDGQEQGVDRDGQVLVRGFFWFQAVQIIDHFGCRKKWRPFAVIRLLSFKRKAMFDALIELMSNWIDSVGDLEVEADGVNDAGDFWLVWEEWQRGLRLYETDEYTNPDWSEAMGVTQKRLWYDLTGQESTDSEDDE